MQKGGDICKPMADSCRDRKQHFDRNKKIL